MEAEKGYFLQPIYTQSLDHKIYFNSGQVSEMQKEFKDRLIRKRQIIQKMKYKCKEMSLKDVTLICDKCKLDVSLLKTINFESNDYHHAKCVFGNLRRVEIDDVKGKTEGLFSDNDSQDFLSMYEDIFKEHA